MINIAIIDDEKGIRNQIKQLIENRQPAYHIDTYSSGEEFLVAKTYYDIIYLDIQMNMRY